MDKLTSRFSALEDQIQELRDIISILVEKSELEQEYKDNLSSILGKKGVKMPEVRPEKTPAGKSVEDLLAESQGLDEEPPL